MKTVVSDIIDHYLALFDIKSFYFAMFAPYVKLSRDEYRLHVSYRPTFPKFGIKTKDMLKGVNICAYLTDEFEKYHQRMLEKNSDLRPDFSDHAFGFISRVKLAGGKLMWLRLIDFNCEVSDVNLEKVRLALKILKTGSGLIVESGNSYHFYGDEPFDDYRKWQAFYRGGWYHDRHYGEMKWPKTAHQVIGRNWQRLCLCQGFAMLRVNQCSPKPLPLKVIEYFQGGELEEVPPKGYPCHERQHDAYEKAIDAFDKAETETEEKAILADWPVPSEGYDKEFWSRFCQLPCEFQGSTLLCPE